MPLPKNPQPSVNRQPQGVPVGGQFAPTIHSEPEVSLSAGGGNGSLPPLPPSGGGPGGPSDDAEREANIRLMTDAAKRHAAKLIHGNAKTIHISARDNNGTVRFDDVLGPTGKSIDDEYGSLAQSLTIEVNANRPGGRGIPAEQILGNTKSASIDVAALLSGEIKIVGSGRSPRD